MVCCWCGFLESSDLQLRPDLNEVWYRSAFDNITKEPHDAQDMRAYDNSMSPTMYASVPKRFETLDIVCKL